MLGLLSGVQKGSQLMKVSINRNGDFGYSSTNYRDYRPESPHSLHCAPTWIPFTFNRTTTPLERASSASRVTISQPGGRRSGNAYRAADNAYTSSKKPEHRQLGTFPRRTASRLCVASFDGFDIRTESLSESRRPRIGQPGFGTLERTDHSRTDANQFSELRLGEPCQNAKVGEATIPRSHFHEHADLALECSRNLSQGINLGRAPPALPCGDGINTEICSASEVAASHSQLSSAKPESFGVEPQQESPAHTLPSLTVGHCSNLATHSHRVPDAASGLT